MAKKSLAVIICLMITSIFLISCDENFFEAKPDYLADSYEPVNFGEELPEMGEAPAPAVKIFGNGVYYFEYTGVNFGKALSRFLKENPTLKVETMSLDNTGTPNGYFVIMSEQ